MATCDLIHVSVPAHEPDRSAALAELRQILAGFPNGAFAEVTVDLDPFPALLALVNGEQACLTCIRYEGDPGFSSRNPGYRGPAGATIRYMLSNGQVDEYPAAWAYSRQRVFEALEAFARTRRVPETIAWFNDAGDGSQLPGDGNGT